MLSMIKCAFCVHFKSSSSVYRIKFLAGFVVKFPLTRCLSEVLRNSFIGRELTEGVSSSCQKEFESFWLMWFDK